MCPISIHPIHLFAVSGRKCYDASVSLKNPSTVDHTPASDLVAQNADALDIRAANERQALVRASLKSLPPVQQQAIELAFYEGLTHTEISERLHVPLGTIKTRIRLGMEKLRDGLQTLWEEELGIPN